VTRARPIGSRRRAKSKQSLEGEGLA
jgi:hypothetical protein